MNKKHDQGRRDFLKKSLQAVPAVYIGSSLSWQSLAFAGEPPDLSEYKPVYFEADEWRFLKAACDRLIPPGGEGPGAVEANVPVFIDWQMESDFGYAADWYMAGPHYSDVPPQFGYQEALTPREYYRRGIKAINAYCREHADNDFASLDEQDQTELLKRIEQDEIDLGDLSSARFFAFLLQNTKEGYFADPMYGGNKHMQAWEMIGFPGARASYLNWADKHDQPYPLGPVSIKGERSS